MRSRFHDAAVLLGLAILAGCTTKPPAPVAPAPPPPAGLSPINQNLTPLQAVWHVRSALNVAALSCVNHGGVAMVGNYNRFLQVQKPLLATAYAAELDRFRDRHGSEGQRELDRFMTRLYNHFALPPSQSAFCAAALAVAQEALTVPPAAFQAFALTALLRIDRPAVAPVQTAQASPMGRAAPPVAAAASAPAGWRIQLGAFSGRPAAEAAWAKIKARAPTLGAYTPYYQPVPGKPLVRLQLSASIDRADALKLCALAAASGFDCLPVSPSV